MALRLITGTANAGKTAELHRVVREIVARGGSAVLLLPAEPDVSRDTVELAPSCPVGLAVTTLDGYMEGLWRTHGDGRRIIGEIERYHVLEEIGSEAAIDPVSSRPRSPGMTELVEDVVLRVAEMPHQYEGLVQHCGTPNAQEEPATQVLAYAAEYMKRVRALGLVERAEALSLIAERAALLPLPDVVAIGRFTGFTAAQERFITDAATARNVLVTLTYDPATPATAAAGALAERLACVAQLDRRSPGDQTGALELQAIERHFGDTVSLEPGGAVVLSAGAGEDGEAERIVAELQQAHHEGVPFAHMAVAFRRTERHILATARSCVEAGIPVSLDVRARFTDSGLGAALVTLLEYQNLPEQNQATLAAMRAPYCPGSSQALDEVDARLRRGGSVDNARLAQVLRRHDPGSAAFLDRVQRASRGLERRSDTADWYRLSTEMLARSQQVTGDRDTASLLDAAAQRTFARALSVLAEGEFKGVRVADVARSLRRASLTTAGPDDVDAVRLMSMERLRGLRFAVVILGGLTADEFPGSLRETTLASPGIAAALTRAGFGRDDQDTLAAERLLFYQAATRATARLVLSYTSVDATGRENPRSVFVEEIIDLYRDPQGALPHGEPLLRVLGPYAIACDDAAPATERRTLRSAVRGDVPPPEGTSARLDHARYRVRTRPESIDPAWMAALAERTVFSASDIETYLGCPFRWFIERVIRPAELDSALDAAALGRLGHALLHGFYEAFKAAGHERVRVELLEQAKTTFTEVARNPEYVMVSGGPGEQAGARVVREQVWRLIEEDATFLPGMAPVHTEWAFGMSGDDEPEDLGGFSLIGRIDRIDASEDGFVVTDYKRSTMPATRGRAGLAAHGWVQLPLYAAVVARRFGLRPLAGLYRGIAGGKPRGFVADAIYGSGFVRTDVATPEEIDALIADAIELSRQAVQGMRSGAIPAEPLGGLCPKYCSARTICPRANGGGSDA